MEQILNQLLSTSSTIILPHFGAIIKIGDGYQFNEFLKYNDGKLIAAIEENKGISKEEATEVVSDYIRSIKETLNADKKFDVGVIGSFAKKGEKVTIIKNNSSKSDKKKEANSLQKEVAEPKENKPVSEKDIKKPIEAPKKEEKKVVSDKETAEKKEELAKAYTSTNLVVDRAIEKITGFKTLEELDAFTKEEKRDQVLKAITNKKELLSKPKTTATPISEKPKATTPKVEAKKEEEKKTSSVEATKKEDSKEKVAKGEKEDREQVVKKEETKVTPVTPPKVEKNKEKKKDEETPLVAPISKETKKEAPKAEPESIKTPTTKTSSSKEDKEEDKIEGELIAGAIVIEKEAKKRKRNRLILWAAILFLLIGSTIIGFIKKNEILALINKTEVAENKSSEDSHKKEKNSEDHKAKEDHLEETTASNPDAEENSENNENSEEVTEEETTSEPSVVTEEVTTEEEAPGLEEEVTEPKEEAIVVNEVIEEVKTSTNGKYNIIAGAFSSEDNAKGLVSELIKKGFSNAKSLGKYGSLYLVSIDNFDSRNDAKSSLSSIEGKGYSGWIKKL
jgi:cell division septation protein DedD